MDSYSSAADPHNLAFAAQTSHDGFDRQPSFTNARSSDAGHWQKANVSHSSNSISEKMEVDYSPSIPPPYCGRSEEKASPPPKPPQKRIPRPRNAFMIFRSAFWAEQKINRTVEHDHRHISRIVGHCWNRMSEMEKDKWRAKAAMEKDEHTRKHPDYVFSPTPRAKRPVKRKVKRNGPEDLKRCEEVADLLLMGKQGEDLAEAIKAIKLPNLDEDDFPIFPSSYASNSSTGDWSVSDYDDPPFRSPLLPPSSMETTPVATPTMLSADPSPTIETYSRQRGLPYSPESPPYPDLQRPHMMVVDQPGAVQPYKSALFQIPGGSSPAHSAYSIEGLNQYFTHNANSFDTLDSVGYPTARSPTPAPDYYGSPPQFSLCGANVLPRLPIPESIYAFPMLPRRSPSPEPDHYTTSTRLPEGDGHTVPALPEAESPARVTAEPVVFRNPFR